jgi:hypothetical protein
MTHTFIYVNLINLMVNFKKKNRIENNKRSMRELMYM